MADKSNPKQLAPYLCAFAAVIPAYLLALLTTGQQMLAVASASFAALLVFMAYRLIQLRGKLTLAITVFGIPLLVAVAFASYQALNPFIQRQRSITMLREAGINFRARSADQLGEWKRDRSGNMLPIWLANRIGPDCMSELGSITCGLDQLQSIAFRDLDTANLSRLYVDRRDHSPTVSDDFVDWLNSCDCKRLDLEIWNYSDADGEALAKLKQEYRLTLHLDEESGDLAELVNVKMAQIYGDRLSVDHAKQLAQWRDTVYLNLDLRTISVDAIRALDQPGSTSYFGIENVKLGVAQWRALASLHRDQINLRNVDLTALQKAPTRSSDRVLGYLSVHNTNVTVADARRLIQFFHCREFMATMPAIDEEVDSLWMFPQLTEVRIHDGKQWTTHHRGGDEPQK